MRKFGCRLLVVAFALGLVCSATLCHASRNAGTSAPSSVATNEKQQLLDSLKALAKAPENETIAAAIVRYREAQKLGEKLDQRASFFAIKLGPKMNSKAISALEESYGTPLPESLKTFCQEYGRLTAGDFETALSILPDFLENGHSCRGLVRSIIHIWEGRPEFSQNLTKAQIDRLNQNYFIFGMRGISDNEHVYYYFDKAGKFGNMSFDQESGFQSFKGAFLLPMLEASPAKFTLDQLISRSLSAQIRQMVNLVSD